MIVYICGKCGGLLKSKPHETWATMRVFSCDDCKTDYIQPEPVLVAIIGAEK